MNTYQEPQNIEDLIEVYSYLSEILLPSVHVGLPGWVALSGSDWPLYDVVIRLANEWKTPKLDQCIRVLSEIHESSLDKRITEYESLFIGNENPPIWLNESYYLDGRIFGPIRFSILEIYKEAGLDIVGAEFADHAGMELAFLAYLAEKEKNDLELYREWKQARKLFSKNHCERWLPEVGRLMSHSVYPGWSAIGLLIIALFSSNVDHKDGQSTIPIIEEPDSCTLCGFCVQVCPTFALRIDEDEKNTRLELETNLCTSCGKCLNICPEEVMTMSPVLNGQSRILLRESPLASCTNCGDTTFSQAEIAYTQSILGNPDWLAYCVNCRSQQIGKLS